MMLDILFQIMAINKKTSPTALPHTNNEDAQGKPDQALHIHSQTQIYTETYTHKTPHTHTHMYTLTNTVICVQTP